MTRRFLVVDGTNIVMRCAFGVGAEPASPDRAVQVAIGMLARAITQIRPTHIVTAVDSLTTTPSWRRELVPTYKANRTHDTRSYNWALAVALDARRFYVELAERFEADDIIATVVARARDTMACTILSNDSDLLALVGPNVNVARPETGGTFSVLGETHVLHKYGIAPRKLTDWKALCGEPGDNIAGVPGIGPKRASALLDVFDDIESIIACGLAGCTAAPSLSRDIMKVVEHQDAARLARRLVALRTDVPLPPIKPSECALGANLAAEVA